MRDYAIEANAIKMMLKRRKRKQKTGKEITKHKNEKNMWKWNEGKNVEIEKLQTIEAEIEASAEIVTKVKMLTFNHNQALKEVKIKKIWNRQIKS